jgi:hypothetical protein
VRLGGRLDRTAFAAVIDRKHARIRRSAGELPLYGSAGGYDAAPG